MTDGRKEEGGYIYIPLTVHYTGTTRSARVTQWVRPVSGIQQAGCWLASLLQRPAVAPSTRQIRIYLLDCCARAILL
jgi:hypothetical protein